MPNRIIKESICTSEDINSLTPQEEVFFYRLMVNCDDYGRFDARESILKARLYPLRQLKSNEINCNLKKLSTLGMILLYQNNGKDYLQMTSWEKHQQIRNKRSKYPAFDDEQSIDINCNQLQADVTVIQSNPNMNPNTNPNPQAVEVFIPPEIITEWNDYIEMRVKIKKPATEKAKQLILSKLQKLSTDTETQKAILNQSTVNNWQDIYALKQEYGKKEQPKPQLTAQQEKDMQEIFGRA